MSTLQAIVLGLVQGITEFLPISSTAHLVLVPRFLGWDDPGLHFAIWTNTATLAAVMLYYRHDLWSMARQFVRGEWRLVALLTVASVPVAVFGLTAYGWLETAGRAPLLIAITSIVFALLLAWADRAGRRTRDFASIGWRDALWVGCAEALALIPGTSRSGVTMTAGLALGLRRTAAARFSLLMAIPVGGMALIKDLLSHDPATAGTAAGWPLAIAVLTAGVSAYVAIGWMLRWLSKQTFSVFVAYRIALGLLLLVSMIEW